MADLHMTIRRLQKDADFYREIVEEVEEALKFAGVAIPPERRMVAQAVLNLFTHWRANAEHQTKLKQKLSIKYGKSLKRIRELEAQLRKP